MIDEFTDDLIVNSIHVRSPTDKVFLCGGLMSDIGDPIPRSIRDAFYKIADFEPLNGSSPLRAEDVEALHIKEAKYPDLLEFECDIAQLSKLVLLFSESFGSAAELGAFARQKEIAERMLVVIRDKHSEENSFIKIGVLESLKIKYGRESYYVLDDDDANIIENAPDKIDKTKLAHQLHKPVFERLNKIDDFTTFNASLRDHQIKFFVGLVQEFGALTLEEVRTLLIGIGIDLDIETVTQFSLCSNVFEWTKTIEKGDRDFVVALADKHAVDFRVHGKLVEKNGPRRRDKFREYWKINDNDRFRAVIETRMADSG